MSKKSGKFIVIEGIDGAGTTTQAHLLADWLQDHGKPAAYTGEPSVGPIGALLRQVLAGRLVSKRIDGTQAALNNDTIALLFAADRMDHLDNEVLPLLGRGVSVVCDRYYHSSITYQSLEGEIDWIRALNSHARSPDVTYLIDIPAAEAARRRSKRARQELYETSEIQGLLEPAYRQLPQLLPKENIVIIDGRPEKELVHRTIVDELRNRFGWE